MYEFTKKEIRSNFKKTKYGKKVNIYLYSSLLVWLVISVIAAIFFVLYLYDKNNLFIALFGIFGFLDSFALLFMCYFDGKRDGAIEQYKKTLN